MPTENNGKLMCEDDGVELEEFEDSEGVGYECPDCHWIVMASELEPLPEPERRHALLYLATEGERYSPRELRYVHALTSFAKEQGWEVQGALVERRKPTNSAVYSDMIDDFKSGKVDALIMWDEQTHRPAVYDTEIPGVADWPRDGHLDDAGE
jgi:hypothetical protein